MKNVLVMGSSFDTKTGWGIVAHYIHKYLKENQECSVHKLSAEENNLKSHYRTFLRPFFILLDFLLYKPRKKYDMIICTAELFLPLAALIKKFYGKKEVKLVLFGYGTYVYYPFIEFPNKLIFRPALEEVDLLLVSSSYSRKKVEEFYEGNIHVVPLGVNLDDYHKIKGVEKEKALIFVGEQKARKGVKYLFLAFKKLLKDHPNLKLYMIGKKSEHYSEYAKELDIHQNLIFTGRVPHEELLKYYSKSLVHILPSVNTNSSFEGYGLVHLEANACGIPSIGSLNCGNEEVIKDGYNGFLCHQEDVQGIYERLNLLLTEEELYEKMCENALKHAKEYSWEKSINIFEEAIKEEK